MKFLFALLFPLVLAKVRLHRNPVAFEGDIGLDPETRAIINGDLSEEQFKGVSGNRVWSCGKIPYSFDRWFDNSRRQLVNQAIEEFTKRTCVRFVPRNGERDYVHMVNQNACWSIIGRGGGQQLLKIGHFCQHPGTVMHEMMHAAGFYHEQSRNDRDSHVNIFWNNIQRGEDYNFQKYRTHYYGQYYDLNSIMHYRNDEFSRNGRDTIQSKKNHGLRLGNNDFSKTDIAAIRKMYRCNGATPPGGCSITPGGNCVDKDTTCQWWANRGECQKNSIWMFPNCPKACKQC